MKPLRPAKRRSLPFIVAILAAAAGCGESKVEGPGTGEVEVGVLVMTGSPGPDGWPAGDRLRVSVAREGEPVAGARVTLAGEALADRGAYHEPDSPLPLVPDSLLVIETTWPGSVREDTIRVPSPPAMIDPMEGGDFRGCSHLPVRWLPIPDPGGGWVYLESDGLAPLARPVAGAATFADVPVPYFASVTGRVAVLSLSSPIDPFRPDAPLPPVVPAGLHRLAWTAPHEVRLDAASPLQTDEPDSLQIEFRGEETVEIAWSPDTVRVHALTVWTQFFAEGNLRWQIASDAGFLPPVCFGVVPAGAHLCAPPPAEVVPIETGVEYLVQAAGRRHAGEARAVPLPAGNEKGREASGSPPPPGPNPPVRRSGSSPAPGSVRRAGSSGSRLP